MATCERCGNSHATKHSLDVEMFGRNVMLAQFILCADCYSYGERIEPIARVNAFLNPSHVIIADTENTPTWYYVRDERTSEYVPGADGRVWYTLDLSEAQDRLAEVTG